MPCFTVKVDNPSARKAGQKALYISVTGGQRTGTSGLRISALYHSTILPSLLLIVFQVKTFSTSALVDNYCSIFSFHISVIVSVRLYTSNSKKAAAIVNTMTAMNCGMYI